MDRRQSQSAHRRLLLDQMIQVQSPGMFTTVQDLGRYGYGPLGVSPSGAADSIALRLGNLLLANPLSAAALEMTLLGGTFLFPQGATVALTGSDFGATVNGEAAAINQVHEVAGGGVLKLGPTKSGARCYLCVAGGIEVAPLLGSSSTHILSGLGGLDGRALRKGDQLKIGAHEKPSARSIDCAALEKLAPRKMIRTTIAPQSEQFGAEAIAKFYSSVYLVTEESNRMGLRLEGAALDPPNEGHMTSEGVSLGAIQVPSKGQPIILFVEQQTTGGYPKIANVISADLASVGQLRPRDEIRFELVTPEIAHDLIREQEELIASCISI